MSIEVSRRYYHDSYTTTFAARVIERTSLGDRPAVVLAETYFYPSSGGQPYDLGAIGPRRVVEVAIRESDHAVLHVHDGVLEEDRAEAAIDWSRRRDHMQQHTGQHILSQSLIRIADAPTIGFHLGQDYVSIDIDTPALSDGQRSDAFTLANEVVTTDAPVRAWFPTAEELAGISLRKTPDVEGALRIVAIGDFDVSACGGTHVARTGEVGLIHCLKTEKLKRGVRVHFLAGDRARRDYADKQAIVAKLSAALTCSVPELPDQVARLQGDLAQARRELGRFEEEALDREAQALAGDFTAAAGGAVLRRVYPGRTLEAIKGLALRLTAEPGRVALLAAAGERTQFVFARSENLTVGLKPALDRALAAIGGGKGGGARVVQGGGPGVPAETAAAALAAAEAALTW